MKGGLTYQQCCSKNQILSSLERNHKWNISCKAYDQVKCQLRVDSALLVRVFPIYKYSLLRNATFLFLCFYSKTGGCVGPTALMSVVTGHATSGKTDQHEADGPCAQVDRKSWQHVTASYSRTRERPLRVPHTRAVCFPRAQVQYRKERERERERGGGLPHISTSNK